MEDFDIGDLAEAPSIPTVRGGRHRRTPDENDQLLCNSCGQKVDAIHFYRKTNGAFDSYCKECRKGMSTKYQVRSGKQEREAAWAAWYRKERRRLELQDHEYPPGYEPEELKPVFESSEVTPEEALRRLEDPTRRLGPPA